MWPPFMNKWVLSEEHRKTVQLYWQSECGQSFYMTARFGTVTTQLYNIGTYCDICIYSGLWHPDSGMRNRQHCRLSICGLVEFVIYWIRSKSKQKSDDETSSIVKGYHDHGDIDCNNNPIVLWDQQYIAFEFVQYKVLHSLKSNWSEERFKLGAIAMHAMTMLLHGQVSRTHMWLKHS